MVEVTLGDSREDEVQSEKVRQCCPLPGHSLLECHIRIQTPHPEATRL